MSIFSNFNNFVTSVDSYGTVVNFNYFKKSNKHQSFFGGISTIILLIFVVIFGLFKGILMLKKDSP